LVLARLARLHRADPRFPSYGRETDVIRALLLGGTGNFGSYIARALSPDPAIQLILASRSLDRAVAAAEALGAVNPAEAGAIDLDSPDLTAQIAAAKPNFVIHAVGPFQAQDYRVAEAAIAIHAHYCDLADARAFVAGIGALDGAAKAAGVAVIAGASSVPCLTAAFLDHYAPCFERMDRAHYGISAAQATNRGLGTAAAILSYVGLPFQRLEQGRPKRAFGWQGLTAVRYPELGVRLFGDCDVPDLALFPDRYPDLHSLRFVAGHEIKLLHLGTWALSWLVRLRLLPPLERYSARLLRWSFLFDRLGSDRSGFHLRLDGVGRDGKPKSLRTFLIARQAHGPYIPCMPAIILARRIATGIGPVPGARPCLDLISLDDYIAALSGLDVRLIEPA
jgi:hypothetical protein